VDYLGFVDEVAPYVGAAWCSIVPLRIGSGTRLKILEAMALGTPVVSTSIGCEGLVVQREVDLKGSDSGDLHRDVSSDSSAGAAEPGFCCDADREPAPQPILRRAPAVPHDEERPHRAPRQHTRQLQQLAAFGQVDR